MWGGKGRRKRRRRRGECRGNVVRFVAQKPRLHDAAGLNQKNRDGFGDCGEGGGRVGVSRAMQVCVRRYLRFFLLLRGEALEYLSCVVPCVVEGARDGLGKFRGRRGGFYGEGRASEMKISSFAFPSRGVRNRCTGLHRASRGVDNSPPRRLRGGLAGTMKAIL